MALNFADLKKTSKNSIDKLSSQLSKLSKQSYDDPRFWKPTIDNAGNGFAIIRFLPAPPSADPDEPIFVQYFDHGFKGPGGWYIEKSRTSIGEADPVSEYNNRLWDTEIKANQDLARSRKRKQNYVQNIYIVSDPGNPDNEGKVFLFRFGSKIMEMIQDLAKPQFKGDPEVDVTNLFEGRNFRLKVYKNEAGFPNYDKSRFDDAPSPVAETEEEIERIWKSEYALGEFIDPANYKSYDELKAQLFRVLRLNEETFMNPPTGIRERPAAPPSSPATTIGNRFTPSKDDDDTPPFDVDDEITKEKPTAKKITVDDDDDLSAFDELVGK